jgi:isopropylmalate/homocitrate/citramalate synthase
MTKIKTNNTLDDIDADIGKLQQETRKVISDIENFDVEVSNPRDLQKLFDKVDQLKDQIDDKLIELSVEDFLLHGSRMTNKNI